MGLVGFRVEGMTTEVDRDALEVCLRTKSAFKLTSIKHAISNDPINPKTLTVSFDLKQRGMWISKACNTLVR